MTVKTEWEIEEEILFQSLLIDLSIFGANRNSNNENHLLISAMNSLSTLERLVQRREAVCEAVDKTRCVWQMFRGLHSQESNCHVVETSPGTGDKLLVGILLWKLTTHFKNLWFNSSTFNQKYKRDSENENRFKKRHCCNLLLYILT